MARKKRRSSKFKDGSTVIDIEEARQQRQARHEARSEKRKKQEAGKKPSRSAALRMKQETASFDAASMGAARDQAAQGPTGTDAPAPRERSRRKAGKAEKPGTQGSRAKGRDATGTREGGQNTGRSSIRQDRRKMALRRRKRGRNLFIAGCLAVLAVVVVISLGHIVVLKHDLYTAQKEQTAYEAEKEQLEKDLKLIDDKENLEEQARNQMRLIMPGETLYIFPENMTRQ